MADYQKRRHCRECKTKTLHVRKTFSDGWGCLLTVITCGLFLPFWIILGCSGGWHCQRCGSKN